jgi:hypothetical protein
VRAGRTARIGAVVTASSVAAALCAAPAMAQEPTASAAPTTSSVQLPEDHTCALVQVIAVNGTTEASKNSDPDADTGWLSRIVRPVVRTANADGEDRISRAYVPYPASFGGLVPTEDQASYANSVRAGIDNGKALIAQTIERCPDTKIFLAGYSQGGQVASAIARDIGTGNGPVSPEQFAGAALMSDPTRGMGAPVFQAGTSQSAPGPVPGTDGQSVSSVNVAATAPIPEGRGISPNTAAADFGSVADRVASFCVPGDLACDTPPDSDVFQVVANVAGQAESAGDPVRALLDVAQIAGQSVLFTAAETVAEDVQYSEGSGFTIAQASRGNTTLSRMARYTDPTRAQDPDQQTKMLIEAGTKLAGMALGASITVAKKTLTPENLGQVALAGAVNPGAGASVLAGQLAVNATDVVTPVTITSGMRRVVSELEHTVTDTAGLVDMATTTQTWKTIDAHGAYDKVPFSTSGQSPAALAQQWILAAANDVAISQGVEPVSMPEASSTRREQIRSGASGEQLFPSQWETSIQKANSSILSEALASVTS